MAFCQECKIEKTKLRNIYCEGCRVKIYKLDKLWDLHIRGKTITELASKYGMTVDWLGKAFTRYLIVRKVNNISKENKTMQETETPEEEVSKEAEESTEETTA